MKINIEELKKIMPQARTQQLENFMDQFNLQLPNYQIDSSKRVSAFLAQGAYECGELRELVEIMYYTTSDLLRKIWPRHFPNVESTLPYLRNAEKLGNFVYANRLGNGNIESGDGYKYRGRGWFNATGKDFYQTMTNLTHYDFISKPDDMAIPKFAILSACEEWSASNLNMLADEENFTEITHKINGGLNGLDERLVYYHKARAVFAV